MEKLKSVRKEGGSRCIALTEFIPKDWQYVETTKIKQGNNFVTIKIEKVR